MEKEEKGFYKLLSWKGPVLLNKGTQMQCNRILQNTEERHTKLVLLLKDKVKMSMRALRMYITTK